MDTLIPNTNTKMSNLIKVAKLAKENGFIYMASVVKSVFDTTYYHVVKIDLLIEKGVWPPAEKVIFENGARGSFGTANLPEKTILRKKAYKDFTTATYDIHTESK